MAIKGKRPWYLPAAVFILLIISCNKQDQYLDVKRSNADVVPKTLKDFQALLDNDSYMNGALGGAYPVDGLVGSDNYFVTDATYASLVAPSSTLYLWAPDVYQGGNAIGWNYSYRIVEYSNVVLDGLQKISVNATNQDAYNNIKGSALFFRAFAFYNVANLWCKPYDPATAGTDLGIPIRLSSDVNAISTRATVDNSYKQIIGDLHAALPLLPTTPLYKSRPSSVAVLALLAKVYLVMENYDSAAYYANAALTAKGDLLDFNNSTLVNKTADKPFPSSLAAHPEVIFSAAGVGDQNVAPRGKGQVDTLLYASYDSNDLRRTVFYRPYQGYYQFKGTYDFWGSYDFCGIATNELYLIRAECAARAANTSQAMADINKLLAARYLTGKAPALATASADSALVIVFNERRKELPFTGNVRWEDLRRLNKDSRFAVTLHRSIAGTLYSLPPNDPKYVLPFPDQEIQLSHLQQNPR